MYHYYRVHFVCQPGGSRKTEYHVVGTLGEVRAAVEEDLSSPEGAYHALIYGEEIAVQCWEDGRLVARIDLHPFIEYRLPDRAEPVRFAGEGAAPAPDLGDEEALCDGLFDGSIEVSVSVDWARVPWPTLGGEPLPADTPAAFAGGDTWDYGIHDEWDNYVD